MFYSVYEIIETKCKATIDVHDIEVIHDIHTSEFNSKLLIFNYSHNAGPANSYFRLALLFIQF